MNPLREAETQLSPDVYPPPPHPLSSPVLAKHCVRAGLGLPPGSWSDMQRRVCHSN